MAPDVLAALSRANHPLCGQLPLFPLLVHLPIMFFTAMATDAIPFADTSSAFTLTILTGYRILSCQLMTMSTNIIPDQDCSRVCPPQHIHLAGNRLTVPGIYASPVPA